MFARGMPRLRRAIAADLDGSGPSRQRVLACAVRLLDIGLFRIGSEEYADQGGGLGLTTIRKEHVTIEAGVALFDYPAKGGVRRLQALHDPVCVKLVRQLLRRNGGDEQLLAYREGRSWVAVGADDVNTYLKERLGDDFSAKDFRTWNATVMAAVTLAADGPEAGSKTARKRAIKDAVGSVSELLGNTPAVARRSYIDPRVFDRYLSGWTIAGALERTPSLDVADDRVRTRVERAVLELVGGNTKSSALERVAA